MTSRGPSHRFASSSVQGGRRSSPLWMAIAGLVAGVFLVLPFGGVDNTLAVDPVAPDDFFENVLWGLQLEGLSKPDWAPASSFTTIHVSPSGEVLVVALDNGGILFLETDTGERIASAYTDEHGAVRSVMTDHEGRRAVFVYDDGYVAAVDSSQEELLMSRFSETGAPPEYRDQVGAALSADGRTLVVTGGDLRVYRLEGEAPSAFFELVAERESASGPHLFIHPMVPYFVAMDGSGQIGVFDMDLEPQNPPVSLVEDVAAVAASHDGGSFAVLRSDGRVFRYDARLVGSEPVLELRYEQSLRCTVPTCGAPFGVALNTDGSRVVAWTNQEVLWAEGANRGVSSEDARRTDEADTVRLTHPVDGQWTFGHVAVDRELTRALVSKVDASGAATPGHFLLPSTRSDDGSLADRSDPTGLALAPYDGRAFLTRGDALAAFSVAPSPASPATGGGEPEGGGAWSTAGIVAGVAALAILVLLAFLVALVLVARRGDDSRLISELELEEGALAPPASARPSLPGGGVRGAVRPVSPSAPPEAAPPDGLLVLHDFSVPGSPRLKNLRLSLTRPGVVRMTGDEVRLRRLLAGLKGRTAATGVASAGGADRGMTPLLFSRHLRVGLADPGDRGVSPRAWYAGEARRRVVPEQVASRRLHADLGWMGRRLDQPYRDLSSLDQWKVRLAVAFLDRPRVLVLWTSEVPAGSPDERLSVERVLQAVGRHYRAAVVLLDPGGPVSGSVVREWAHEEIRLGADGFRDRALLEEGRVVSSPGRADGGGLFAPGSGGNGRQGVARANGASTFSGQAGKKGEKGAKGEKWKRGWFGKGSSATRRPRATRRK